MGRYQAILFDLDGTLLDTLEDLADSVNAILGKYGFPLRDREEIRRFLGNGSERLMKAALPQEVSEADFAKYLQEYQAYYKGHMEEKTAPYDGILPLLGELRKAGLKIGVVSNKFDLAVKGLCEKYFPGYIDGAAGEREAAGIRRKPAPDMVLTAVERLGVDVQDCLYVGDSEVDILTAQNAGMDCVSVTWGFREEEFLRKAGATHLAHTTEELKDFILT
ncbi:MAG: HAD family hydrolase [Anaerotignum sp.]